MAMDVARKLMGVVTGAAKHAIWYVRYQVEGVTRDHEGAPAADEGEK